MNSLRTSSLQAAPCRSHVAGARSQVIVAAARPIEKLKRAPSAYNLFYRATYPEVKQTLSAKGVEPNLTNCAQVIRDQWVSLPAPKKAPFEHESTELKTQLLAAKCVP